MLKFCVITSCSKSKLQTDQIAKKLYKGQLFQSIVKFTDYMDFDLWILSAKYGLIPSSKLIEPYDKKMDLRNENRAFLQNIIQDFHEIIKNYDKIIIIMGKNYLSVLKEFLSNPKIVVFSDKRGNGGYYQLLKRLMKTHKWTLQKIILSNSKIDVSLFESFEKQQSLKL